MDIAYTEILVWLIIGALAGSFTGMLVKGRREGFGRFRNLGIGLVGALIGGFIFRVFKINLGLGNLAIRFDDLLAAFIGSLIFLGAVWLAQRRRVRSKGD